MSANANSIAQKFKYNGKELQDDDINGNSLDWYDYGWRMYDPSIGRWNAIDPLNEKYYSMSSYSYAGNTPTRFVDFDGQDFGIRIDLENGTITISQTIYTDGKDDSKDYANQLAKYLNDLSGKYALKTKEGKELKINYAISVSDEEGSMVESDDGLFMVNSNQLKAEGDDEANYLNGDGALANAYNLAGVTLKGGDDMRFCRDCRDGDGNKVEDEEGTVRHEDFHALGASHDAIGPYGKELNSNIVGATLLYASKNSRKLKIRLSNQSGGFLTKKDAGDALKLEVGGTAKSHLPRVKVHNKNKIKLNGTIIKTE